MIIMGDYELEPKESIFFLQKRRRMQKIQNFIKQEKEIAYRKMVAMVVILLGSSDNTARKYIQTLKDAEYITIDNGIVRLNEK